MNREHELEQKVQRLENTVGKLLEALQDALGDQVDLGDTREALNPPKKLTEAQQEAQDVALLRSWYGATRYEREFAHLDAGEKAVQAWKVYG